MVASAFRTACSALGPARVYFYVTVQPNRAIREVDSFVRESLGQLLGLARLLAPNESEAEDLVQDCLVRVVAKWDRVRQADDGVAYACRIMLNEHVSQVRKKRVATVANDELAPTKSVPDHSGQVLDSVTVSAALQRLSPRNRAIVVMRFYLDMDAKQIGERINLKPSSVRARITRAVRELRSFEHGETQEPWTIAR